MPVAVVLAVCFDSRFDVVRRGMVVAVFAQLRVRVAVRDGSRRRRDGHRGGADDPQNGACREPEHEDGNLTRAALPEQARWRVDTTFQFPAGLSPYRICRSPIRCDPPLLTMTMTDSCLRRVLRAAPIAAAGVLLVTTIASAHDMFVKPARYFVRENADVLVRVLNGTFSKSENAIARARVADLSVVGPAGRTALDTSRWSAAGDTSTFTVRTAAAGTYVLGVSTRPNQITMTADTFDMYLAEDGIPDLLAQRRRAGDHTPATERYSKHVKAMIQVGDARTDHYATALGYPAEIIPLANPYGLRPGGSLRIRTVVDGAPVRNQFVLYGGRAPSGARLQQRSVRSDSLGVATIPLRDAGVWYIKFIHIARLQGDSADYESKWATLTFEVR